MLLPILLSLVAAGEVVARVDGQAIEASEVALRAAAAQGSTAPAVLQDIVNERLLAADAERAGYARDARVAAEVDRERRRIASERFQEKELGALAKPDEAMLRQLFHSQADQAKLRLIAFTSTAEAAASKERIAKGAAFAAEAARSADVSWMKGEARWLTRGQMDPGVERAAFGGALQEVQGPVELKLGAALVQVQERQLGTDAQFAERREALARFAVQQIRNQARQHYLKQLRKEAGADLDEAFVRSTGKRLDATNQEEAHVIARIHGRPFTYGELLPEVRRLARGKEGGHFSGASVKIDLAHALVDQRLLEEAAVKRGHGTGAEVEAALAPVRRDAMGKSLLADLRERAGSPSAAEVEAYYGQNLARFQRPGRRTCSHLLAKTREHAEAASKRIQRGQRFEDVARESSIDLQSAPSGGLLGEIPDDRLAAFAAEEPALAEAIRTSKVGAVAGPVKSRSGWHLLLCQEHLPPSTAPLAEVREAVAAALQAQRADEAVRSRLTALRTAAKVSIDERALERAAAARP